MTAPNRRVSSTSLHDLSPSQRTRLGSAMIVLGVALIAMVTARPEAARVPLWVLWFVGGAFSCAGVAVAVYSPASPGRYRWAIVAMLGCMLAAPLWIAFGPGTRTCTSNVPLLASGAACRGVFGVGALVLAGVLIIAVRQALSRTE